MGLKVLLKLKTLSNCLVIIQAIEVYIHVNHVVIVTKQAVHVLVQTVCCLKFVLDDFIA